MKVYNSTNLIDDLQQQTETFLHKATSEWQIADPLSLLKQPAVNKWSAAQCLEHLNSYGRYYLPEINIAIVAAKENNLLTVPEFKAGFLGNYFTKMMQPEVNGKKMSKMSSPKEHRPLADLDSRKVVAEFIDQQERFIELLETAREMDLNKVKVPISIGRFIKLKLGDVFMFLTAHTHRHVLQAERALNHAEAPFLI